MGVLDKIKDKLSSPDKKGPSAASSTPAASSTATPAIIQDTARSNSIETGSGAKMTTYQGKCHCGHHEWTFDLSPEQSAHILCHCDTCKILGGGAYTMNQIVPKAALKITKGGEPGVYTYYGDSGKGVHCYYCPKCTTHIYHHQEVMGPDTIIARTGVLAEGRKSFKVGAEIYGKDKMSWEPKIAETFETLPPS